jgi:hypothetical protein
MGVLIAVRKNRTVPGARPMLRRPQ